MKNLLKLFGAGILTGAGTRAGIMLVETLLPNGFSGVISKLKTRKTTHPKTT